MEAKSDAGFITGKYALFRIVPAPWVTIIPLAVEKEMPIREK